MEGKLRFPGKRGWVPLTKLVRLLVELCDHFGQIDSKGPKDNREPDVVGQQTVEQREEGGQDKIVSLANQLSQILSQCVLRLMTMTKHPQYFLPLLDQVGVTEVLAPEFGVVLRLVLARTLVLQKIPGELT